VGENETVEDGENEGKYVEEINENKVERQKIKYEQ
jgi:hypothetical protein